MQKSILAVLFILSLSNFLAAQKTATESANAHLPGTAINAMQTIDPLRIRQHVRFLSHDLLEGRGTGQRGGDIAAEYIATQFRRDGVKAAGDKGRFSPQVPF